MTVVALEVAIFVLSVSLAPRRLIAVRFGMINSYNSVIMCDWTAWSCFELRLPHEV